MRSVKRAEALFLEMLQVLPPGLGHLYGVSNHVLNKTCFYGKEEEGWKGISELKTVEISRFEVKASVPI